MMMMMLYTINDMMMLAVAWAALPRLLSKPSKALSLPIRKLLHYTCSNDDDDADDTDEDCGDDDKDKLNVERYVF